jgi:uncharacterized membrane protein
MPPLHPLFVHFPIGLFIFAFLLDLTAYFRSRDDIARFAWWTHGAASVAVILTVCSGLLAASSLALPAEARETFDMHQQYAFLSSSAILALFIWRTASRGGLPKAHSRLYLLGSAAALLVLLATAWFGGELVYRFATGVHTLPHP